MQFSRFFNRINFSPSTNGLCIEQARNVQSWFGKAYTQCSMMIFLT